MSDSPIIVSYGGGTNSTAMLIGMHERGLRPALIMFADTGDEKPHTYEHLEAMQGWLVAHDFPQITVVRNGLPQGVKDGSLYMECLRLGTLPAKVFGRSSCSMKWKVEPQVRYQKQWMLERNIAHVRHFVGYDADEHHRANKPTTVAAVAAQAHYESVEYPLIEWDWGRDECVAAIARAGLKQPGKSSCFMCPSSRAPSGARLSLAACALTGMPTDMAAARRNHRRRDWPRGLYEPRPGYYVFRTPAGDVFPLGRVPLAVAKNEALAANAHLASVQPGLVARLQGADHTVADLLDKLPEATKENTARNWRTLDRKITQAWGTWPVHTVTVKHVAELLEAQTDRVAVALRARLVRMFRRGMSLGWVASNPAESTERARPVVKRGRLTLETFRQVQALAPEWFQRTMSLALVLGADESTLVTLHRRMVLTLNEPGRPPVRVLDFTRVKTGQRVRVPLTLRLEVAGLSLAELVPARVGHFVHNPDPHGNAGDRVTAAYLSKTFTRYRKAAGLPAANEGGPSFHEIRSLAKRLYLEQGNVDTLALLGHADERTGAIYANARDVAPPLVKVQ